MNTPSTLKFYSAEDRMLFIRELCTYFLKIIIIHGMYKTKRALTCQENATPTLSSLGAFQHSCYISQPE